MTNRSVLLLIVTLSYIHSLAQNELPLPTNYRKAYIAKTRSHDGRPGTVYWQNTANYKIAATLNPDSNILKGTVAIDYSNNSPDTLKQLVLKLYPNLYQASAMRNMPVSESDLHKGMAIAQLAINGDPTTKQQLKYRGTNLYLTKLSIHPKSTTHLEISYSYPINKTSFIRTGQVDSGAYVIAYFFPRVAVYDDIDGWNEYPYLGKEEFYNDYANFDVDITIPSDYLIWATGEHTNPEAVYQPAILQRLTKASTDSSVTDIITTADLKTHATTTNNQHTWHFQASNVVDFAFTASNHYVWKAATVIVDPNTRQKTRVDAVYNPDHKNFEPVVSYAKRTVELISTKYPSIPFPYPHMTVFEGLDAMEYPMMINDLPFEGWEAVQFTAHEIYHSLFPFLVGSNETKYSFMDEGWATFAEFTLAPEIAKNLAKPYDLSDINSAAGADQDVPVMTLTPQLYGKARFSDKDLKPALALHYLRGLLGDQTFSKAIRYYIQQWQGKHPTPYDFFYCMNKGAGTDLNWFWKNWFFEKAVPDLAISMQASRATIVRKGNAMVPIHLTVTYKDGSVQHIDKTIACWRNGERSTTIDIPGTKPVAKLELGDQLDADIDPSNNIWMAVKQ